MDKKEALDGARGYCSRKEVCCVEVCKKLSSWHIPEDWHQEILDTLIREKFLDEDRYARAYVHDKVWLNKWGRIKVRYMLRSDKIPAFVADEVLAGLDKEQYEEMLRGLLQKKRGAGPIPPEQSRSEKARLFRFACGRGFEPDLIMKLLDQMIS